MWQNLTKAEIDKLVKLHNKYPTSTLSREISSNVLKGGKRK
ncbi:unnamed protein product [marine sediment metagenome]|uniref:Uncharacterized protein n=1 Tax=marine sediment metagenome TaxID=412755 RepID=X1LQ10_9ZZZZ